MVWKFLKSVCTKREYVDGKRASNAATSHGLPQAPRTLLANRVNYELTFLNREVDRETDSPLDALYRIYEHLILDQHIEIRNEFESFWYNNTWAVCDIPDPQDPDHERYACLACIPALLCLAFNRRIELGLPRDAPPIFTRDMLDEWRAQRRKYEKEPSWASNVAPLRNMLAIPHWDNEKRDFVPLEGLDSPKTSKEFATKNILVWNPHVHFA